MFPKAIYTCVCIICLSVIISGCGGPQSTPERVARAYVEAMSDGDCDEAEKYLAERWRKNLAQRCGPDAPHYIRVIRIDDVQLTHQYNEFSGYVVVVGKFEYKYHGGMIDEDWGFRVEKVANKWYSADLNW